VSSLGRRHSRARAFTRRPADQSSRTDRRALRARPARRGASRSPPGYRSGGSRRSSCRARARVGVRTTLRGNASGQRCEDQCKSNGGAGCGATKPTRPTIPYCATAEGRVKMPVPTMLPMTKATAVGRRRKAECARGTRCLTSTLPAEDIETTTDSGSVSEGSNQGGQQR
jgi:hypothetical protein